MGGLKRRDSQSQAVQTTALKRKRPAKEMTPARVEPGTSSITRRPLTTTLTVPDISSKPMVYYAMCHAPERQRIVNCSRHTALYSIGILIKEPLSVLKHAIETYAKSGCGQGYTGSAVSGVSMTSWNSFTVPSLNGAGRLHSALPCTVTASLRCTEGAVSF